MVELSSGCLRWWRRSSCRTTRTASQQSKPTWCVCTLCGVAAVAVVARALLLLLLHFLLRLVVVSVVVDALPLVVQHVAIRQSSDDSPYPHEMQLPRAYYRWCHVFCCFGLFVLCVCRATVSAKAEALCVLWCAVSQLMPFAKETFIHSFIQAVSESSSLSVSRSVSNPATQSVIRSVSQSVSQSASQSVNSQSDLVYTQTRRRRAGRSNICKSQSTSQSASE
jgi:hypothetical protein